MIAMLAVLVVAEQMSLKMCNEESATTKKCNSTGSGRDRKRDSDYSKLVVTTLSYIT